VINLLAAAGNGKCSSSWRTAAPTKKSEGSASWRRGERRADAPTAFWLATLLKAHG
jgi:hypothetical protein